MHDTYLFSERNITVKHLCAHVACLNKNVNFIKTAWGGRSDTEDVKMHRLDSMLNIQCVVNDV